MIRTIRGRAPMMGVGGVVRNADTRVGDPRSRQSEGWAYDERHPPHERLCGGCCV